MTFPTEQDILMKREMLKNEKHSVVKSGGNGTRAAHVHASASFKKQLNESAVSTTVLIDYLITGSKETERLLGSHERTEMIGKSLDEFRSK